MLSRNLVYAAVSRRRLRDARLALPGAGQRFEPIMLAIAAVTLSTMHQSSLGSLYLLMPNMLASQWWSPVMPVSFFLSSIVAGIGPRHPDRHVDRERLAPDAST